MHCSEEILLRRLAHGVLLVVGQDDHVFSLITEVFGEITRHVPYVIDTATKLTSLAKVVYTNKQRFSPTTTVAVSKSIVCGSALSKVLRAGWRRRRRIVVAMTV